MMTKQKLNTIVFGGSGFLGSHVADALSLAGHKVRIYDLVQSKYIKPSQEMVVGDILDRDSVKKAVEDMDILYNFAGLADIDEAKKKPIE